MSAEPDWDALRGLANQLAARAYAPYSRLPVGAAGLADTGGSSAAATSRTPPTA